MIEGMDYCCNVFLHTLRFIPSLCAMCLQLKGMGGQ
jgi:hypothetical protein